MTARDRVIQELQEQPGLSKSELHRRVGGNPGVFRRLLQGMIDTGVVEVTEQHGDHGLTRVHRLADGMEVDGDDDGAEGAAAA